MRCKLQPEREQLQIQNMHFETSQVRCIKILQQGEILREIFLAKPNLSLAHAHAHVNSLRGKFFAFLREKNGRGIEPYVSFFVL